MAKQLSLPGHSDKPSQERIVNVASVTHRTPFRYPGGKTWLVPRIRQWLADIGFRPGYFIEPFAGGAIIGLTVAFENLAEHVILCELDEKVGAVWQTIIEAGEGNWLAEQIEGFDMDQEIVKNFVKRKLPLLRERALQTIVHNRVSRGGILAKGAGFIKTGEGNRGFASRWYPQTLARRIRAIDNVQDRLSFVWGDGLALISEYLSQPDAVFFIDPPYSLGRGKRAGCRLYSHFALDHERLFELMGQAKGEFLMTYENDVAVREMAEAHGFQYRPVAMKNTHHAKLSELLISKNFLALRP